MLVCISWPFGQFSVKFGIFDGHLVYFPPFWYFVPKNLATLAGERTWDLLILAYFLTTLPLSHSGSPKSPD
jgi:hypothetical protein